MREAPANAPHSLAAVPSPCTSVCKMDPRSGWCLGCRRSIEEIAAWSVMTEAEKRAVWAALPVREVTP